MFRLREANGDLADAVPGRPMTPVRPQVQRQRHFLIVTAPFGAFSRMLAAHLRGYGARCRRVILNGGDLADWGLTQSLVYRGTRGGWRQWLEERFIADGVTDLIVHGDSQSYAVEAIEIARTLGLGVHVFEEGYFRPHWVTLERDGVNARSRLPRDPAYYSAQVAGPEAVTTPVGRVTPPAVRQISAYHLWGYLAHPLLPNYRSPYLYPAALQAWGHVRRYIAQRINRRAKLERISAIFDGSPVFMALLQRPGDSQLTCHSSFKTTAEFISMVVDSFARNGLPGSRLLFKTHPLDQGLEPHERHVRVAAETAGVGHRVFFADDGHFPTMISGAHAVLSVNSTGGLSALEAGLPTITLGRAIYDMPGLTHQGGLDSFWRSPTPPDMELFRSFRAAVMAACQINGAYSTKSGAELVAREAARRLITAA